jgi:regulator of sigma E protease
MHFHELAQAVILFVLVLGFMVLVHEFGHFAVAKLCGVKVETFSIGFGPRLFGIKYGDTDYRISALPLGGYVKMAGDTPGSEPEEGPWNTNEFNAHPRWQRVLIALAGPFSNFVLSLVILAFVAHFHHEIDQYKTGPAVVDYVPVNTPAARAGLAVGDTIIRFKGDANPTWDTVLKDCALNVNHTVSMTYLHNGQAITRDLTVVSGDDSSEPGPEMLPATGLLPRQQLGPIRIETISDGTPAERAGLKTNDQIVSIDNLEPHSVDTLHAYLKDRSGAPASLKILRNGRSLTVNLVPERNESAPAYAQWQIGFLPVPNPVNVVRLPLGAALVQSFKDNRDDSTLILRVLKGLFTRHVSVKAMSGPVGIAQQISIAFSMGKWALFELMANISINLGIFNLLPIPILDGGMIVFLLIESMMRRDVNEVIKERIYQVAFVCIILFAVFVLFNDITRLHLGGH